MITAILRLVKRTVFSDRIFAATLGLSLVGVLVSAVKPWLAGSLVDDVIKAGTADSFWKIIAAAAGTFVLSELMSSVESLLNARIEAKTTADLQARALRRIYAEPFASAGLPAGERIYSVFMDRAVSASYLIGSAKEGVTLAFKLLLTLALVFWLDWRMAALAVVLSALGLAASSRPNARMLSKQRERELMEKKVCARLDENFTKLLAVKCMRVERRFLRLDFSALADLARASFSYAVMSLAGRLASDVIFKVAAGVVSLYGLYRVKSGQMSAGALTMAMGYLVQLIYAQREAAEVWYRLSEGVRCGGLDDGRGSDPGLPNLASAARRPNFWGLSFEGVAFSYGAGKEVFRDMSLRAEHGRHTAIAGPSGCGKTTALFLVAGLLRPARGRVSLGGCDVSQISGSDLREQLSLVLQEPLLWDASLEDNIRFFSSKIADADLALAMRTAGVDVLAAAMPEGLKTVLGGANRGLSRGQKQRVALARALALRPSILLLDEALASLEPESERLIIGEIRRNYPGMSVIAVTHRPAALAADRIIWMRSPSEAVCEVPAALFADPRFAAIYDSPGAA
jgi:ABC-type bacteriocin/lantibiotic exporter with double-glycine peptidase domain